MIIMSWILTVQLCTDPAHYHCSVKHFMAKTEQVCVSAEHNYWRMGNGTAKCQGAEIKDGRVVKRFSPG